MATQPISSSGWSIRFDRTSQVQAAILAGAFVAVFFAVFEYLWFYWTTSPDWSHGPIIPLFSAYLVYSRWDRIRACPIRHTWVGLVLMVLAILLYNYSLWGLVIGYIRPTAMMLCLVGIVIYLCGLPVMRYAWVPIVYLFFAIPLPKGVYFAITDPMRQMAATVSTALLALHPELDIERVGSTIEYFYGGTSGTLGVADACSGMRSTMTLCALGVAVAFVSERPWWHRLLMVASCVPIAIFSNFVRVTTTCVLHIFVDPRYATGTYHTALGLITLLLAFAMFSALGWVLNALFVESSGDDEPEPDESDDKRPAAAIESAWDRSSSPSSLS